MLNVIRLIFYHPCPESSHDVPVAINSYSELIGDLWDLARTKDPGLVDHIGKARCTFVIVSSSFLYTTGSFSHICSSRPTCLSIHPPPCSLAAEIGSGSAVMMAKGPSAAIGSVMSSSGRLLTWRLFLSSPTNVRLSL